MKHVDPFEPYPEFFGEWTRKIHEIPEGGQLQLGGLCFVRGEVPKERAIDVLYIGVGAGECVLEVVGRGQVFTSLPTRVELNGRRLSPGLSFVSAENHLLVLVPWSKRHALLEVAGRKVGHEV